MKNVIEMKNISKAYDNGFEIKNMNMEIKEGIITGYVGENGAGKTSSMKLLLNVLKPDSGEIEIFGKDALQWESQIKEDIGFVLEDMFFPEVLHAMDLESILKDIYKNWDSFLYKKYLDRFALPQKIKIKDLSKGMKKKLEIATALSHRPKLLLLDEPTAGLDPIVRNEILDIFLDFMQEEDHSIFLSSHITSDLDKIADDIILLDKGKILLQEEKDTLLNIYGILKCDEADREKIDPVDILSQRRRKYSYEILVRDKNRAKKEYPFAVVDDLHLEDLMLLLIKGERA